MLRCTVAQVQQPEKVYYEELRMNDRKAFQALPQRLCRGRIELRISPLT
jgi:hypothetical protein